MKLHEHQAKALLSQFGISVPRGRVARTPDEAEAAARIHGGSRTIVKAQIHAGDRARNGGIRSAATPQEARKAASIILGMRLATSQTPPQGFLIREVHVEEEIEGAALMYAAVALDRKAGRVMLIASAHGGEDFETRAQLSPEIVRTIPLRLGDGGADGDFAGIAREVCPDPVARPAMEDFMRRLAAAFVTLDASLLEVNPVAITHDGRVLALDAKLTIDDNALLRHEELRKLRDETPADDDPIELEAERHQINFLRMEGDIGVVVNGAGLALATLDMLHDAGGRPANFMDIRTTASSLDVAYGFRLILANPNVRAILVNVYGGGMQRCDTIAEGIAIAARRSQRIAPIVIRMAGTHAEFARTVFANAGLPYLHAANSLEAARKAVDLAKRAGG